MNAGKYRARILSALLAAAMIMTSTPFTSYAAEPAAEAENTDETVETAQAEGTAGTPDADVQEPPDASEDDQEETLDNSGSSSAAEGKEPSDSSENTDDKSEQQSPEAGQTDTGDKSEADTERTETSNDDTASFEKSGDTEEGGILIDAKAAEAEIITVEAEMQGVYQFGDAPTARKSDDIPALFASSSSADTEGAANHIYQEMKTRKTSIDVSSYNIPYVEPSSDGQDTPIGLLVSGVLNDHADLYFVQKRFTYFYSSASQTITSINITYKTTDSEGQAFDDDAWQKGVDEALAAASECTTDLQKAIALHDYLAINCEYNSTNMNADEAHTTYGVFVKRTAVCEGYALAYKYLLDRCGIGCYMATSDKLTHAWNLIELDGKNYWVDVTWDDPTWESNTTTSYSFNYARHTYMFCGDSTFEHKADDGTTDWKVTAACEVLDSYNTDTKYDSAFWRNITKPLVLHENDCYYMADDSAPCMKKADLTNVTEAGTTLFSFGRWPYDSIGTWPGVYSGLFRIGDRLYYNDSSSIRSVALNGDDDQSEFTLTDTTDGYIYNCAYIQGKVYYLLAKSPNFDGSEQIKEAKFNQPPEPGENVGWSIDAAGKLTVTGNWGASIPWSASAASIKTAEINLTDEAVTSTKGMFEGCENLTSIDFKNFDTGNVTDMGGMFKGCSSLTELQFGSGFNTANVTTMSEMFMDCSALTTLDLSAFDAVKMTDALAAKDMFTNCPALTSIKAPKNVTVSIALPETDGYVWKHGDDIITELPKNQPESVEITRTEGSGTPVGPEVIYSGTSGDIEWKIDADEKLTITGTGDWDKADAVAAYENSTDKTCPPWYAHADRVKTASISVTGMTDASYLFFGCTDMTSVDVSGLDTTGVTDMACMFCACKKLTAIDLDNFNTGNVTNMRNMFESCSSLAELDVSGFDTSNVTYMAQMFRACKSLTSLNLNNFDTRKVNTTMYCMFGWCSSLASLDLSSFDVSKAEDLIGIVDSCSSLTSIKTPKNVKTSAWLPRVDGYVWKLADGTVVTEFPQNRPESVVITRVDPSAADPNPPDPPEPPTVVPDDPADFDIPVVKKQDEGSGVLFLNAQTITLHSSGSDNTFTAIASFSSADIKGDVEWSSADSTIASVKKNSRDNTKAVITGKSRGKTVITAKCGDMSATLVVTVLTLSGNEIYDISRNIWVDGFLKESPNIVYTGQKITQNIRVYYNSTLLKEKTDYTVSYKNNINAATYDSVKAPCLTITMKGQYSGKALLYFTIRPKSLSEVDVYNAGTASAAQAVNYAKKIKLPVPELTFANKKLAANKDFEYDYTNETLDETYKKTGYTPLPSNYTDGDAYSKKTVYTYTIKGKGNFEGSIPMRLVVLDAADKSLNFNSAKVTLDKKQYEFDGTALKKTDVAIMEVKLGSNTLSKEQYDYDVIASNTTDACVIVYPKTADYFGSKRVALKLIGDRDLSAAGTGVNWKEEVTFSRLVLNEKGGFFLEKTGVLTYGSDALVEGTHYTVKYGNATKAGNVTVTFTGIGRYRGKKTLKYAIVPETKEEKYTIRWKNSPVKNGMPTTPYQSGGAMPDFVLTDENNIPLTIKTDYKVKYTNNKTAGETMTCEITGKGNYNKLYIKRELLVTSGDLSRCMVTVPDMAYSDRPDAWKSKVTIKDINGKALSTKDYEIVSYTNSKGVEITSSPAVKDEITVNVKGIGNYEGVNAGEYHIFDTNISKLQIVIDPQTYTGKEIHLLPADIHVYLTAQDKKNKSEYFGECYEIVGYKNNIKSGTGKVTLRGLGNYGGEKTYSFKILKRNYEKNSITDISLNPSGTQQLLLSETDKTKLTLTARLTAQAQTGLYTNATVVWTSSNTAIADIVPTKAYENSLTSTAVLHLKKEGTVTITAIAQESSKKATCTMTIVEGLPFTQAGQTIYGEIGKPITLTLEASPAQEVSDANIVWSSSNKDVVSLDGKNEVTATETGKLISRVATVKQYGSVIIKVVYKNKITQECYIVVKDPNEEPPTPETGALLTYRQQEGVTDDTPYINKMLRDYEWGDSTHEREVTLYLPAGVYHIDATAGGNDSLGNYKFGGIVLTTNQKLVMSPNALLAALPNNKGNSQVVNITGREGVSVSGGQIIGERKEHSGNSGEWGHGIAVFGGKNITISDVDISQCWGDGIYLGFYDGPNTYSDTITIKNCNLHHNRRNNLSITDARNVTVKDCAFNYANGTDPQYGIDIEPNKNRTCSNVTISHSTFRGNAKGTIQILGQSNAHVKGVTIENCTGDKAPVTWSGLGGSVSGVSEKGNKWNG